MLEYNEYKKYDFRFFKRMVKLGDLSDFTIDWVNSSM